MGRLKMVLAAGALLLIPAATIAQEAAPAPAPASMTAPAAPAADAVTLTEVPASTAAALPRAAPTPGIGQPVPRGMDLQTPVTSLGEQGKRMNNVILLPLMTLVSLVVLGLLGWVIIRYNARANPVPSKTSHNTTIEVIWTAIPVLILLFIAVPSFALLSDQYDPPKPDLTIKATGHQWYWSYEYPDQGGFSFDAVMLTDAEAAKAGEPRNLATDNRVIVPAGAVVKVLVTAADVLHSWAVPSFWVKMDAVPGRINETWFKVDRPGVYYGQCSELCGTKHGFMPIAVEVVSREQFDAWVAKQQADAGIEPTQTAAAAPAAAAL